MADNIDDYLDVIADLSIPENYDPVDRYHDFRAVFLDTEQGRRVLKQIMAWGHLLRGHIVTNPIDPYRFMLSEGERNLLLRIFAVMMVEPPKRQTSQATTSEE